MATPEITPAQKAFSFFVASLPSSSNEGGIGIESSD